MKNLNIQLWPLLMLAILVGCGGGSDGANDSNDEGMVTGNIQNDSSSGTGNTVSDGGGGLTGYYNFVATPQQQSVGLEVFCAGGEGQVAVYNGRFVGWADFYGINASVSNTGNVSGAYTAGSATAGSLSGSIGSSSGSGTWNDGDSPCNGTWTATRIEIPLPSSGLFTLTPGVFPAALKVGFTPAISSSTDGTACPSSSGYITTDGRVSSTSLGVTYNGYAQTTQGYRLDVSLKLNPDSGAVEGTFEYDPLNIAGTFDGDLYFEDTQRTYADRNFSATVGCKGTWAVTTIDQNLATQEASAIQDVGTTGNEGGDSGADYSSSIPYCQQASDRILANINPGMTPEQVLATVGKPFTISGLYGSDWRYTLYSIPSIDFAYSGSPRQLTTVEGYDSDDRYCSSVTDEENSLIANANSLAVSADVADYSNEIPTCTDAAVRILAKVFPGMSPGQVRAAVGKPVEISGLYGSNWRYSQNGTITVEFAYTGTPRVITTVEGYSVSYYSNCQ